MKQKWFLSLCLILVCISCDNSGIEDPVVTKLIIADHTIANLLRTGKIPESAITQAKEKLHIAYGHTSHGSQITNGMSGLVGFSNGGGLNNAYSNDLFKFNNGGTDGALDLHDGAMAGDCGYYPAWVNNTREYLNNENNADVNVIIWSWCGQVNSKYENGKLNSEYLEPMNQLEQDYPNVKFVYMTGHLEHWDDESLKAANQVIRDYCKAGDKILYDFADIESYNPDGVYYEFTNDNCDYYPSANGSQSGNWATEWQNSHAENIEWYSCYSAHSEPLNANMKAYAAWWLWCRLAGWNGNY